MMAFDPAVRWGPLENVYYGPEYSDQVIAEALNQAGLLAERIDNIEERVAELLSKDAIVARFNGRMEYGPRSLGNRSVLYPPKDPEVNQWLNKQLGRTEFMPFAPAVLASEAQRLFFNINGCEKTAEFMTVTFDCTEEMKRKCPAAVHIDGTARPQLVSAKTNESFYKILKRYFELTGIPAVINTSFNMHEEPIVCSPGDAIRAFLLGGIDYLAIGRFLVKHPQYDANIQSRFKF
jgi:carbamoyltransferase